KKLQRALNSSFWVIQNLHGMHLHIGLLAVYILDTLAMTFSKFPMLLQSLSLLLILFALDLNIDLYLAHFHVFLTLPFPELEYFVLNLLRDINLLKRFFPNCFLNATLVILKTVAGDLLYIGLGGTSWLCCCLTVSAQYMNSLGFLSYLIQSNNIFNLNIK
ncbi:hypothetical protein ACJX0J_008881, partial [Zea mays]